MLTNPPLQADGYTHKLVGPFLKGHISQTFQISFYRLGSHNLLVWPQDAGKADLTHSVLRKHKQICHLIIASLLIRTPSKLLPQARGDSQETGRESALKAVLSAHRSTVDTDIYLLLWFFHASLTH